MAKSRDFARHARYSAAERASERATKAGDKTAVDTRPTNHNKTGERSGQGAQKRRVRGGKVRQTKEVNENGSRMRGGNVVVVTVVVDLVVIVDVVIIATVAIAVVVVVVVVEETMPMTVGSSMW